MQANSFKKEITYKLISLISYLNVSNKWLMLNCDGYIAILESIRIW